MSQRDHRKVELRQLWFDDPSKILGMYRHLKGLDEFGRLPNGGTIASLIENILDDEQTSGKLTDDPRTG